MAGLADGLREAGVRVFGPSAAAAELEGSKKFMKDLVARAGVPTAAYASFDHADAACAYIAEVGAPVVVKTDGLAAGKGVIVASTVEEAQEAARAMIDGGAFDGAGTTVVVEEFLAGEECSFFAISDGTNVVPLGGAQDHKAVGEGDTGPNTGGMGAYSPAPVLTKEVEDAIMTECVVPTVRALADAGAPFVGVLFAGLMVDEATGKPKLLEFNVRFGDPECQCLMKRLADPSRFLSLLADAADGALAGKEEEYAALFDDDLTALVVVMAANGYPGAYEKGTPIGNLAAAGEVEGVTVFHAGTRAAEGGSADGKVDACEAAGGRVLGVTASARGARGVETARARAYEAVDAVDWKDGFVRRDIAWRAIERL